MNKIRKIFYLFLIGFAIFFLIRLGYGFYSKPNGEVTNNRGNYMNQSRGYLNFGFSSGVQNIAKSKYGKIRSTSRAVVAPSFDQKYEKIANVGIETGDFDNDEKQLFDLIKTYEALIQYEKRSGLKKHRLLNLSLGVAPDKFEDIIKSLKTIGTLKSLEISKTDKTNEYKDLKAKQISLTKSKNALEALKNRDADVKDLITLEQRILGLEQQIQTLGVNLGDFDAEHEFVTVKAVLRENMKAVKTRDISIIQRSFVAFKWSVKYYALFLFAFACAMVAGFAGTAFVKVAGGLIKRYVMEDK